MNLQGIQTMKLQLRPAALALALCLAPATASFAQETAPAAAASYTPSDIDRLTDLVLLMMPLGEVLETELAKAPEWNKEFSKEQAACLQAELSNDGYRRYKRVAVEAYAAEHPERMKKDVELLGAGAASAFNRMMKAGVDAARENKEPDVAQIMAELSADELRSFMALLDAENKPLLQMIGVDEALSGDEDKGEAVGERLVSEFVADRATYCHVDPAKLK